MPRVSALNMPDVPTGQLPPHLELQRTRVSCASDAPTHTGNILYSGAYAEMGVDNSLCFDEFLKNFRVDVISVEEDEMEFDMIGIDASIANAFRRILIAEVKALKFFGKPYAPEEIETVLLNASILNMDLNVYLVTSCWQLPTMAIEKVLIANNTSVVQDEVLSHRLGLIPIKVDPRLFDYMSETDTPNEKNTIVFKLNVQCGRKGGRLTVKSNELKWLPNGSEFEMVTGSTSSDPNTKKKTYTSFSCSQDSLPEFANNPITPKHEDIIISKLGPGQGIELEAHAVKGLGKSHAKWSPVCTTWYRMLPEVVLLQEVKDEKAEELVKKCPVNVFDIEDIGKGRKRATVARPRLCTLCRECIRGDDWEKRVALRRVKDHFIFRIESAGALPPEVLFTEAIKILEEKCERVITELT
ncbi:hypothetical protein GIB67_013466 [Kingdonia uniflora]|uniref:DNA-directed RNA polymerase RpoA/D/Rpb3-type domain-containing protein n=1 Tax=Kingdonia uniflora TaxID=39325 RepID=A0A7J7LR43_9MAGN|nr:hypothetical protein GIB67_013466 [Kingdonia uniflora]